MSHTSKEFIKCCFDNVSIGFMIFYLNISNCENKKIAINMREKVLRAPYNHLIKKKLNICNIPLSESEKYDI